jgi:hypothetical protein
MEKEYTYLDHSEKPYTGKIVFHCSAPSILEADTLYETTIGKDPKKQPYIGCQIQIKKNISTV